ncbi:Na+/H+ antiporter NhaA [Litoribrevibacter albus]|uniref:Na(+)/H(+) antiporter NhaA n=1 Tax=Litoribrevibacter albus TaxID=1473156 RepID=A0AA37S6T7_9GAMM|nr:Na+/H+ antiporter NhaA [Litoribrevibacter albus]GLQ29780.1 Na(+)/H(+) antiporter NhaA [Litoribrevibacter albus]
MIQSMIKDFLKLESASGILLILATAVALVFANTPLDQYYELFLSTQMGVHIGALAINKPLLLWINDGLMAVFFFLIGLELKRELVEGELSDPKQIILPAAGAVGGMLVPALIYVFFNWGDEQAITGWAIPAATDIAFALGILAMLGSRVPVALKVFLVSLAIIDDIGAIIIIAIFYTSDLSIESLVVAGLSIAFLAVLNKRGVVKIAPYLLVGLVLWVSVLKSGVHATLAGVVLAFFIPLKLKNEHGESPARQLEHDLHSSVAFVIVPIFAFANAGVDLRGMSLERFLDPLPIGIAMGLFLGKQLGVFGFAWLVIKLGLAKLPSSINWAQLYGVAILCGIGFTMSLFIGSLAFEQTGESMDDRLGILFGSLLSSVVGFLLLHKVLPKAPANTSE